MEITATKIDIVAAFSPVFTLLSCLKLHLYVSLLTAYVAQIAFFQDAWTSY
jgi:hypothetical protein